MTERPLQIGDEVSFRHQALTRFGYVVDMDPERLMSDGSVGGVFVRMKLPHGQTTIWLALGRVTRIERGKQHKPSWIKVEGR